MGWAIAIRWVHGVRLNVHAQAAYRFVQRDEQKSSDFGCLGKVKRDVLLVVSRTAWGGEKCEWYNLGLNRGPPFKVRMLFSELIIPRLRGYEKSLDSYIGPRLRFPICIVESVFHARAPASLPNPNTRYTYICCVPAHLCVLVNPTTLSCVCVCV